MAIGELNRLLKDLTEGRLTRLLLLEHGVIERAGEYLAELLPSGRCLVVADATTWPLAGDRLAASLGRCGYETDRHLVPLRDGYSSPLAGDAEVEALDERLLLAALPFSSVVAVGGGTINDIAKLAAFRRGLPYAVIPTTPSMNGYTSGIAAILQAGVKTTISSRVPVACLADLTLLQAAPARMIAAGLGDLVSRPVSLADWYLSHRLLGTEYSAAAVALAETGGDLVDGIGHRLAERDPDAVARLTAALLISGLAMDVATTSAPASGGEHMISHFLDMTCHHAGAAGDFHGCQVGVATLVTAALYERLLSTMSSSHGLGSAPEWHPWPELAASLEPVFGPLWPSIEPHARLGYSDRGDVDRRLGLLSGEWNSIATGLEKILRPAGQIRRQLQAAACPLTFEDIGVSPDRARQAVLFSRHIRARYTILDLLDELDLLPAWADQILQDSAQTH